MLGQLTPEQAYELTLYHSMEPFGELRSDIRIAQLLEFYYSAQGGNKKKRLRLSDFVLYEDVRNAGRKQHAAEEIAAVLDRMASKHG